MNLTSSEIAAFYATRVPGLRQTDGREWRTACPIHDGERDSFAVNSDTGHWYCHSQCGRGGDLVELEQALSGTDLKSALLAVNEIVRRKPERSGRGELECSHRYIDENGTLLFEVVRFKNPKGFSQRRPGRDGKWIWSIQGVRRVLYRFPEVIAASTVAVLEGERDVDTFSRYGFKVAATCNPGGAGKWTDEYSEVLRGKRVYLFPDSDDKGRTHVLSVAASLLGKASYLGVVEMPDGFKDLTAWAEQNRPEEGGRDALQALAGAAIELKADSDIEALRERWGLCSSKGEKATEVNHRTGQADMPSAGFLVSRRVSDIEAKPVSWLWPGRIARGKVSIIAGNPGLGKSQTTASIAAIVTTGGQWPVDRADCQRGDVVFLSAEDDVADTLRPRLEAAGADLDRVHVLEAVVNGYSGDGRQQRRSFNLQQDIEALSSKLTELREVAAVFIDPITAYLGSVDSHRNAEVRALLAPLSDLAAEHSVAIIGVSHLNKSAGTEALMRVTGSLAFVAASRAAYLVAPDPEDKARRLFLPLKNNIGPDATGLAFRIESASVVSSGGPIQTSRIVWETDVVTATADEVMRASSASGSGSALREAEAWLQETLRRPTPASEISRMAEDAGISRKTLNRAADSLQVEKIKTGMRGGWLWSLAPKNAKNTEGTQERNMGIFGEVGHLREPDEPIVEVQL